MHYRMLTIVVIVLFLPVLSIAQGIKLKGYVYDFETKAPLSGANIVVVGALSGTSTNSEGFFSLIVEKTPVLIYVSYVGYIPQQVLMQAADRDSAKIYLKGEIRKIGQVTISGKKIANLIQGDTLNIVDYGISEEQIILVANPYKQVEDQGLYLTTLNGEILASKKISNAGHKIEIPESIDILTTIYLFKDCFRSIQLLTEDTVYQIGVNYNNLNLMYPSGIQEFESRLLPAKAFLNGRLFSQQSTLTENKTYSIKEGEKNPGLIKTVFDRYGPDRVEKPILRYIIKKSYEKCVSAPVIQRTNDIAIFDFFGNNIEFFNQNGISIRSVPISFHLKEFTNLLFLKMYDIDLGNFTQQILYNEKVNRIWSLWTHQHSGHYTLKEINPDTGEIIKVVEIPDYPFIEKIQVHNNIVYFLYSGKSYPYYRSLYKMMI
ncbi:MAG: carboxypeptidase-like regulatory domain-containing protein [Bacteroidales bacterium]